MYDGQIEINCFICRHHNGENPIGEVNKIVRDLISSINIIMPMGIPADVSNQSFPFFK